jgi:Prealbumin-like fold domain
MKKKERMKKRSLLAAAAALAVVLSIAIPAFASVSTDAGFEGADGNLAPQAPINFDWNSFAPTTWTGTAPSRTAAKIVSGWAFTGLEDAQATTSDSAFAGGTKQDDNCATVNGAKAPNKDDMKRVYVTSKTVSGDVFLGLAWVRIPQNTTSPSAHIGFEFNQGTTPCPAGSDGLVQRTAGDMLIVYDFEGGTTDVPTITLRRWVTSGSCEVSTDSPPCWGPAANLTAGGFAEAKVNTTGSVLDANTPGSPSTTSTLGTNEFGEAIINLTDAGVFTPGVCTGFGKTYAVSRSSGNSAQAQMKDLVGPGNISITNCGTVNIHKQDDAGAPLAGAVFTLFKDIAPLDGAPPHGAEDTATSLTCTTLATGDCSITNVPFGDYWAVETTGVPNHDLAPDQSFTLTSSTPNLTISLTFVDPRQPGAIKVTKTRKHAADGPGDHPQSGVSFTVNGVTKQTDANGVACFDGLDFGTYTVHETVPAGYHVVENDKSVTVDNSANCSDATYVGETVSFHNTPLTNVTVSVDSQVPGGTSSTIDCGTAGSAGPGDDITLNANDLEPGTINCTIVIDP